MISTSDNREHLNISGIANLSGNNEFAICRSQVLKFPSIHHKMNSQQEQVLL